MQNRLQFKKRQRVTINDGAAMFSLAGLQQGFDDIKPQFQGLSRYRHFRHIASKMFLSFWKHCPKIKKGN